MEELGIFEYIRASSRAVFPSPYKSQRNREAPSIKSGGSGGEYIKNIPDELSRRKTFSGSKLERQYPTEKFWRGDRAHTRTYTKAGI